MPLSGIGASTLKALGSVMKTLLTDSCVVKRSGGHVSDGAMGYRDTFATVGTMVCRVYAASARGGWEDVNDARITDEQMYRIVFKNDAVIYPNDLVTQVSSGITYTVTNSIDADTDSPTLTVNASYVSK